MGSAPHKMDTQSIKYQQARDGCQPMFNYDFPDQLEGLVDMNVWTNYLSEINRYTAQLRNMNICVWIMIIVSLVFDTDWFMFLIILSFIIFECFQAQRMAQAMIILSETQEQAPEFMGCIQLEISSCQRCAVMDLASLTMMKSGGGQMMMSQMMGLSRMGVTGPNRMGSNQMMFSQPQQQGMQPNQTQVVGQPVGYSMPYHNQSTQNMQPSSKNAGTFVRQ